MERLRYACTASAGWYYQGDFARSVAVDEQGQAYVSGGSYTYSFPLTDSLFQQEPYVRLPRSFVAKFTATGAAALYSTFIGTSLEDATASYAYVTVDGAKNVYSVDDRQRVFQLSAGNVSAALTTSANPSSSGSTIRLTATVTGASDGTVTFLDGAQALASAPMIAGRADSDITLGPGVHRLSAVYRNGSSEAGSSVLYQVVDPEACQ